MKRSFWYLLLKTFTLIEAIKPSLSHYPSIVEVFNPMVVRVLIGLLVLCSACQTGKIPCPRIKSAKLHKTYRPPSSSLLSARADKPKPEEETSSRYTKPGSEHYIKNVTMEEWDCPRPGAKKYMPKSVKDNIRKNRKKFEEDLRQTRTDSLSTR